MPASQVGVGKLRTHPQVSAAGSRITQDCSSICGEMAEVAMVALLVALLTRASCPAKQSVYYIFSDTASVSKSR